MSVYQRFRQLAFPILGLVLLGCSKKASTTAADGGQEAAVVASGSGRAVSLTPEASAFGEGAGNGARELSEAEKVARRDRSFQELKRMGLPYMNDLPLLETSGEIRAKDEILGRSIALLLCAMKGEKKEAERVKGLSVEYDVMGAFSPREVKFMEQQEPTAEQLAEFSWGYESMHVLLWSLGYIPTLRGPNELAQVLKDKALVVGKNKEDLSKEAKPRSASEIMDMADLYYRLQWSTTYLRLRGKLSDKANEEIIRERRRALNWLIRRKNQTWDEVTTDI